MAIIIQGLDTADDDFFFALNTHTRPARNYKAAIRSKIEINKKKTKVTLNIEKDRERSTHQNRVARFSTIQSKSIHRDTKFVLLEHNNKLYIRFIWVEVLRTRIEREKRLEQKKPLSVDGEKTKQIIDIDHSSVEQWNRIFGTESLIEQIGRKSFWAKRFKVEQRQWIVERKSQ